MNFRKYRKKYLQMYKNFFIDCDGYLIFKFRKLVKTFKFVSEILEAVECSSVTGRLIDILQIVSRRIDDFNI